MSSEEPQVTTPFRCSVASRDADEPIEGTASTVRSFLLVEAPGPWGVNAVLDSRLPDEVKTRLCELEATHRVRPLLIRRPGRPVLGTTRVFASYVRTAEPWLETTELDDVRELLDLDLTRLGQGERPGLAPHEEPVFAVCTHGRHDACCAERGRPLCAALTQAAPVQTWEASHIGGDRFAPNLLVLPHGLYYGRLDVADAETFAAAHLAGRLDLDHLRGRSAYPFSVQAAEIYLRRHLEETGAAPLALVEHSRHGTETSAVFEVDGRTWQVRVHTELGEQRRLTCRAMTTSLGPSHQLVEITALTSAAIE